MELLRPGSEPARAKRHQPTGHLSWQCCDHAIIAGRDGSRQSRTQGCIIHTVVHVGQDCLTWLNRQYGSERGSEMELRGMRPFPKCVDHQDVSPPQQIKPSIGKKLEVC